MSAVILQDEIAHYEVLGRGRPLIFLHGWVGSWRYWIPTMQAASISFRAYAMDLWGFGDSAKSQTKYSIECQLTMVDSFLEKMGIAKVALIGHGLGAIVALKFAERKPDLVDRVMAISYPMGEPAITPKLRASPPADLLDWLLSRIPAADAVRMEVPKTDTVAITTSLDDLKNMNLVELSTRMATPCLLVHGQNDPSMVIPTFEDLAFLPERTHYIVLDQSGHFPMLDETSKFNRLMADFLSLPSGESPRQLQLKEEWKRRVR